MALNKYQYVDTGGKLQTIEAADSATAQKLAPNIARNSGVALLTPAATASNLPSAAYPKPKTVTTPEDRNSAFNTKYSGNSTPAAPSGPISTTQLYQATNLPDASTFASSQTKVNFSDKISRVAGTTLSATGQAIDSLLKQRQDQATLEKENAQANRDEVAGKIERIARRNETAAQDALTDTFDKFKVDQTIKQLTQINTKIVQAQEALEMGLIYEGDRPVRMQLLSGRTSSLQKQGLAVIGALQGTAQVLQGNIDLARSYAETTIDAINTDNANAIQAYGTLLNLYNQDLIDMTKEERDLVSRRIVALEDQNKILEQNKQDVMDLMVKYPTAFLDGGVTLLDSKEDAIQKMLPKMSAMEMQKFNLEVAVLAKQASTSSDADGKSEDKQQLLQLKANGMTYEEALNAFADSLSIDWITAVYREGNQMSAEDQLREGYYQSFLGEDGRPKPGVSVSIDSKGNLVPKQGSTSTGIFSRIGSAWNALFN